MRCAAFVELGVCEVSWLVGMFECLELTRAFAAPHVCDCRFISGLVVLGGQRQRTGTRAFRGGGGWGGAMLGGRGL